MVGRRGARVVSAAYILKRRSRLQAVPYRADTVVASAKSRSSVGMPRSKWQWQW